MNTDKTSASPRICVHPRPSAVKTVFAFWSTFHIPKPETEYVFHPQRKWRFDYAWPEQRIALEVQGGVFGKGKACPVCKQRKMLGHNRGAALVKEHEKRNNATILGWKMMYCTPQDLLKTDFARLLAAALA